MKLELKDTRGLQGNKLNVLLAGKTVKTCGASKIEWDFMLLTDYGDDFGENTVNGCRVYLSTSAEKVFIHSFLERKEREEWYNASVGSEVTLTCGCTYSKCNLNDIPVKVYTALYGGHMIDER